MKSFTPELKKILREAGCEFVRHGRGDHEILQSPISGRSETSRSAQGVLMPNQPPRRA
jgi:hypothetical protein